MSEQNKYSYTYQDANDIERESKWNYTQLIKRESGEAYKGRPLISRGSAIAGGVFYGTYGGEAIVVDPEKYPDTYNKWYEKAKDMATVDGKIQRSKVLNAVFSTVTSEMPYSKAGVENLNSNIAKSSGLEKFKDGTKTELSTYMNSHTGVCRHQALVVGAMLEMFKNDGIIRGDISVDRNINWDPNDDKFGGGHAWARYTSNDGQIIILDVAQHYLGTLENSTKDAHWNYLRPEEKQAYVTPKMGETALKGMFKNIKNPFKS